MEVIVTTKINMSDPFSNCAKELKEAYMRLYSFDYEKACCNRGILISRHLIDRYIFVPTLKAKDMNCINTDYFKPFAGFLREDTTVVYLWVSMGTICALYDAPI